jgi:hypothetical protein
MLSKSGEASNGALVTPEKLASVQNKGFLALLPAMSNWFKALPFCVLSKEKPILDKSENNY